VKEELASLSLKAMASVVSPSAAAPLGPASASARGGAPAARPRAARWAAGGRASLVSPPLSATFAPQNVQTPLDSAFACRAYVRDANHCPMLAGVLCKII
jgi:hypothetical protein